MRANDPADAIIARTCTVRVCFGAMNRNSRIPAAAALLVLLVALDQGTKWLAITFLKDRPGIAFPASWHPHDLFRLQYATNAGAFLSLGSGLSESMRFALLIGLNAVILSVVAGFLVFRRTMPPAVAAGLTMILAGGVGNLIDRIFREGLVVDFMNMGIGFGGFSLRTGIFNIADLAIVGGLILLLLVEAARMRAEKQSAHS